jgi:hypothetical protein
MNMESKRKRKKLILKDSEILLRSKRMKVRTNLHRLEKLSTLVKEHTSVNS